MAKLQVAQFCSLSTSSSWHTWLHEYDNNLYQDFIGKLHKSSGCSYNRQLMEQVLSNIDSNGDIESLHNFIRVNYPFMIVEDRKYTDDCPFSDFMPEILTFPRRIILEGDRPQLSKMLLSFIKDKIKYDYIIIGDKCYVEYLIEGDQEILKQMSDGDWLIANYRKNKL